jgi:hypothetical protein
MTERITKTTKHPVMIFLQGENYSKLKDLIEKRKISRFINEIVGEKLQKDERQKKEQLRHQLIKGYQAQSKNKKIQEGLSSLEKAQFEDFNDE